MSSSVYLNRDTLEVNQISTAAYLIYEGEEMVDIWWNGSLCLFLFNNTDRVRELLDSFEDREARVEPIKFNGCFSKCKRAMFNHPDAPRNRSRAS